MITFETHCNIELSNEFVSFNQQDVESTGYYKYGKCKEFKAAKKLTDQMLVEQHRVKLQQSTPPSYVGSLENEKIEMTQYFIKSLDHAIIICNIKDLVHSMQIFKYRIRELDLPITRQQYHYIIPRLFELMYKFRAEDAHLTIINLLALLLTKGKKIIELKINWRPLYSIFKEHCLIAQQYGSFEDFHSVTKAQQSLNVLIYSCQPFFGGDEMVKEIFEEIGGYFMPHSNYIYFCANVLYLFTPTYHLSEATTIPDWMVTYINYYWSWIDFNRDWDERWLFILSRAFKFGTNVDWTPLLPEIYTKMLKVLDLSVGSPSMSHLKPIKSKIPSVLKLPREDRMEFHSVGKIIACLLNEKTIRPAMNHFKTLISKINLYFHPSNSGHWTTELGEMTLSISKSFLKRNKYIPYSESDIKEFLDIIYPCLVNTLYSKKKNISLTIAKIMNEFSHIAPEYILPKIIENFYSSVDREEVNRLIGGIEVVSTCLHPILVSPKFPEGKTHIYSFMEIMIKSLDPIYTNKASGAFKFFNKLFATILISDENNWIGECENQIEENVTLSTSLFQDWAITFVDSTINFLLQSSTKKGNGKRENTANLFFSETLELFFSSLSNDIYKAVLNRLSTIFTSTFEPEYYKQFGEFLKSSTLRDPIQSISVFLPIFINKLFIKQKIVNNNNNNNNNSTSPPNSFKYVIISDLSDQELKLYISYIGYVIFKGGHGLVGFQDVLIEILSVLMESNSKIVLKSTGKVIRKLIFSTTRIYPSNVRVVPKEYLDKNENHIKYWGSTDLNIILPIEWFEPNEKDAQFAKILIQKFLIETNDKITTYINQLKSNIGVIGSNGNGNGNGSGYDRMKLLNLLKPVYSILRSATFLIPDSTTIIRAPREDFRFPIKKFNFDHGQIIFQEFNTVKQSIFSNYQEIIKYVESVNNNEEVDVLRLISKSLLIMFYCKGDILDHTHDHLFDKWKNHKKLKGRNYLIFKAFRNHLIRQKFYFQQLDLTQLTLDSLYCLLNLSVHNYRRVRETAQKSMVNILHSFPASNQIILPICVDRLLELKTDSEIKGLSFLLQAKTIARRLKGSTEMTRKLIPTISLPLDQKFKPNTRASFSEVKKPLLLAKHLPVLFYYKSKEMELLEQANSSGVNPSWCNDYQKELILKAAKFNQDLVQENRTNLTVTLTNMLNLSKSHDKKEILPWKNHLYLLSCLNYYFSILFNPPPGIREGFNYQENFKDQQDIIKEAIICIAKNSACDYPFSRVYSLNSLSNILAVQTSKNVEFSYQGYFGNSNERFNQLYANDLRVYDSSIAFEVYIYQLAKDEILQVLFKNDHDISRKIIGYMSQDHESESSTTFQFCQSLTNKNYSPVFPNTRMSISNRDFRVFNAKYFFGLLQSAGVKFVEDIKPTIEKLKGKTDKEDFFLLIEILAGFSRFISINDDLFTDQAVKEDLFNYIQSVAFTSLTTCPNECTEAWECAIRFITHNLRHEKFEWFSTLLFSVYRKTSGTNILSGSKSIRFLRTIVIETTWKSKELINKMMEIAKHEFSNNYKQIRMEAMRLFSMLLIYQTDFSIYPPVIQNSDQQSLASFIDAISNNSPNSSGTNSPVIFNHGNNAGSNSNNAVTTDIQMNDITINGIASGIPLNSTTSPPLNQVLSTKNAIKENLMILTFFLNSKNSILIRSAPMLLKAISSLSADSNLEIAKDSSTCIYRMSQEFYLDSNVIDQLIQTLQSTIQSTSWKIRISVLQFIQIFFFNHSFYFTNQQIDSIVNIVLQLTKDPQIEIRENSKITLASILITFKSEPHRIMDLIKKSIRNLNVKDQTFIEKHSSIIILSSIVLASPYDIPSYIPQILEQLSKYSRNTHFKTAASTISEFWRTHKDSWEEDKRQFTETEAEAILSTKVAPSYFA